MWMGMSIFGMRDSGNAVVFTGSRLAVPCSRYLVGTNFLSCPNRISIHDSNFHAHALRKHHLDLDCDAAAKTTPAGSQ